IAVLVRWRSDGAGKGTIEIKEVVVQPAGTGLPGTCTTADFTDGAAGTRSGSKVNFDKTRDHLAALKMFTEAGAEAPFADVCFAPDGRTFRRYVETDPMDTLAGVPHYEITNTITSVKRTVFVPPNGVARYQL